jgi:acyl-CoA thioesterase I
VRAADTRVTMSPTHTASRPRGTTIHLLPLAAAVACAALVLSAPPATGAGQAGRPSGMTVRYPSGPVVVRGASYAGGWKPSATDLRFVNKGISGNQSWEMLARFDQDVIPEGPRAVIVWGFINDIFRSPPDRVDAAVTRARESLSAIVAKARAAGIEPILATEVTIRGKDSWGDWAASWVGWVLGKQSYQATINARVLATNEWLRELARQEGVLLLDLQPLTSDDAGVRRREFAAADGSHISAAGYQAISDYVLPRLRAHLGTAAR